MAQNPKQPQELKNIGYEVFIGLLSILSILNLVLQVVLQDASMDTVVLVIDAFFMPSLSETSFYRLFTAESKSGYFFRNSVGPICCPASRLLKFEVLRVFRLWRVIRLMRNFGMRNLVREFVADRAGNALLTVVFLVFCVLEFGALAVLSAERASPDEHHQRFGQRSGGPTSPSPPSVTAISSR